MPVRNPKELFVTVLSAVRNGTERTTKVLQELSQVAQNAEIRAVLDARVFMKDKILSTIDEAFRLIGEQPVQIGEHLYDVFIEDLRRELSDIPLPEIKRLFVLAKVSQLIHLRLGQYMFLTAAADFSGHPGVGVLLESCLADELALLERVRRLVRNIAETKIAARSAAQA